MGEEDFSLLPLLLLTEKGKREVYTWLKRPRYASGRYDQLDVVSSIWRHLLSQAGHLFV